MNKEFRSKKLIFIFGTRPEAIKLAPVIQQIKNSDGLFKVKVIVTAQHRDMLDQVLNIFKIVPDYDLNIMKTNQKVEDIIIESIKHLGIIMEKEKPEWIIVQGDTMTTFIGGLVAFYKKIKLAHVEAGLRTHDKWNPFPEEINRRLTTVLSDINFAPTKESKNNLLKEGVSIDKIITVGNTVIDSMLAILKVPFEFQAPLTNIFNDSRKRILLATIHRRESFGLPIERIMISFLKILKLFKNIEIIFPVHPNPNVLSAAAKYLKNNNRIHLLKPLDYVTFLNMMKRCHIIVTDSGGIQEEASALGKPVLVVRDKTERIEAIKYGTARLVGTETKNIVNEISLLLRNANEYKNRSKHLNVYGDGNASCRIHKYFKNSKVDEFKC